MTKTTSNFGRLCNQIIRNLAISLIAQKHNLFVEYSSYDRIKELGIELFVGEIVCDGSKGKAIALNEQNYVSILNKDNICSNLSANKHFFQTEECTNIFYNYLQSESVKTNIINKNKYKDRYNSNNDLAVHIRLKDVKRFNPGIDYYLDCISRIEHDNLFIASDDFSHPIIKKIQEKYPQTKLVKENEINTIHFCSTCKHIILSHGSFSAIIGYLGFFSEVYYCHQKTGWCPLGMFTGKGWNPIYLHTDSDS